ncbi:MAG: hypothetical protein MPK62_00610 [Alphaproteobacteria bacterium]|nr:hypothetical protein [Alphaproteobacteria bacterium]MDA8029639.1 hypothetical protein [Alphaproteobacteria bacterium]
MIAAWKIAITGGISSILLVPAAMLGGTFIEGVMDDDKVTREAVMVIGLPMIAATFSAIAFLLFRYMGIIYGMDSPRQMLEKTVYKRGEIVCFIVLVGVALFVMSWGTVMFHVYQPSLDMVPVLPWEAQALILFTICLGGWTLVNLVRSLPAARRGMVA